MHDPWNINAAFWDERMGDEGNDWHLKVVRPAVERLLGGWPALRVLDVARGNGLFTRRLAKLEADVLATEASERMRRRGRRPHRRARHPLPDPQDGRGSAIAGQPANQLYHERPLSMLLSTFFHTGLALDGIEEPAFTDEGTGRPDWGNLPEIPPVLAGRLRSLPS